MKAEEKIQLTADDFREAIKQMGTFIDVTETDVMKICELATKIAVERCTHSWLARDIMTRDVVSVRAEDDLHEAGRLLVKNRISGMPVVDDCRRVVGMLSSADLLSLAGIPEGHVFNDVVMKYILHHPSPQHRAGKAVGDVMNTSVITVSPGTAVRSIATLLDKKAITRVPVVDDENRLVGIVSRSDIVRVLCEEEPL